MLDVIMFVSHNEIWLVYHNRPALVVRSDNNSALQLAQELITEKQMETEDAYNAFLRMESLCTTLKAA